MVCSAFDDGSSLVNRNGNRNVPYLNRNGTKRNLNLNWNDNQWNEICRFLAVRKSFHTNPTSTVGFRLSAVFHPSTNHASNLCKVRADTSKDISVDSFYLPQEVKKEFERIKLGI